MLLLLSTFLSSCASYQIRQKTDEDWSNMTVSGVQEILNSGIDMDKLEEEYGECLLNLACFNNTDINVIEELMNSGHTPNHCQLYAYYKNKTGDLQILLNDTSKLIKKGYTPTTQDFDTLIELYPKEKKAIKKFFFKYIEQDLQGYALGEISEHPEKSEEIIKRYGVRIPYKTILLTKLQSPVMQEKRNSKEWYALVEEIKKNNVKDGILGMKKEDFIVKYGVPDKEYKINADTLLLIYRNERRNNIPAISSTYSFNNTSNYYWISYYNTFDNTVQHSGKMNGYGSRNSFTTVSGGYMDIEQWEDVIYIDKNIVTGKSQRETVTTN